MQIDFEYFMNAWQRHLVEDPNSVVLSDSLGANHKRTEVEDVSNRVYAWLDAKGIGTEDFVLINLDRGTKPVMAILGVWKNGSAFSLVESTYAKDRIEFIAADCKAKIVIDEAVWPEIMATSPKSGWKEAQDHDACLSVYTSGTTGTPKGVLHEYGQIKLEMLSEQRPDNTWRENRKTRFAMVAPLNFVAALKIVVHFLYSGAHIYVLDYDTIKNPRKLTAFFLKNRINETFLPPSVLRLKGDDLGPFMKYVYTGSEPANNVSLKGAELKNTYMMSESLFTVSDFVIDKPYSVCPIGVPRFDLKIRLIDENGNDVPEGGLGEFCYENPFCRGYINNEKENSRHFINGYFHTGDLARFQNGQYVLEGRSDDMIKIDGNRIEPSEIEAVCREAMGISFCVAKGFEKEGFVALYYTDEASFEQEELRKKLEEKLPYYMIPSYFVRVDSIPMTTTGKVDKKGLTIPKEFHRGKYVAPRDEFEKKLADIFSEILEIKNIGIRDDFFDLGGTSLKAMEALSKWVDDDLLSPSLLYKGRSIEKISELYREAKLNYMTPEEKEEEGRKRRIPISPNMHSFWDNINNGSLDMYAAYQLAPIIPAKTLEKRINAYIAKNSIFNMVLEEGENGPYQVYTDKTAFVKLEHMSEKEVKALQSSFVKPFGYGEPLIRIRLVKTLAHTYLFFQAFHMITDGAGMHFMIEDLMKCIKGKEIEEIKYFAWALEEDQRSKDPAIEKNRPHFWNNYFKKYRDIGLRSDAPTGKAGISMTSPATVKFSEVKHFCKKKNITINVFLVASHLLAQSAYNGSSDNMCTWTFHNRGPKDNHSGLMVRGTFCGISRDQIKKPKELFSTILKQNEENIGRLYHYDFTNDLYPFNPEPNIIVTYLEDWFSHSLFPKFVGKTIPLSLNLSEKENSDRYLVLECTHDDENLYASLQYGFSILKQENADRYIAMLQHSMNELLKNELPSFEAFEVPKKAALV